MKISQLARPQHINLAGVKVVNPSQCSSPVEMSQFCHNSGPRKLADWKPEKEGHWPEMKELFLDNTLIVL